MKNAFSSQPQLGHLTAGSALRLARDWLFITGCSPAATFLPNSDFFALSRRIPLGAWLASGLALNVVWLWAWNRRRRADGFFKSLPYLCAPLMIPAMVLSLGLGRITLWGEEWNLVQHYPHYFPFGRYTLLPLLLSSIATLSVLRELAVRWPATFKTSHVAVATTGVLAIALPSYAVRADYYPHYFRPENSELQWPTLAGRFDRSFCLQTGVLTGVVGNCYLYKRVWVPAGQSWQPGPSSELQRVRHVRIDTLSADRHRGPVSLKVKFADGKTRQLASYSRPGYRYQYFRLPQNGPRIAELTPPAIVANGPLQVILMASY